MHRSPKLPVHFLLLDKCLLQRSSTEQKPTPLCAGFIIALKTTYEHNRTNILSLAGLLSISNQHTYNRRSCLLQYPISKHLQPQTLIQYPIHTLIYPQVLVQVRINTHITTYFGPIANQHTPTITGLALVSNQHTQVLFCI